MALRACSECGKDVSDAAAACPHCGKGMVSMASKVNKTAGNVITIFIILAVLAFFLLK